MRVQLNNTYGDIIALENLLEAWREFMRGKRGKLDVQAFSLRLADNLLELHSDLVNSTYAHGPYQAFSIHDPKPRSIHKASVRDRLLHHAIYRILYPFFDTTFIADSYSCRKEKGTYKALEKFKQFGNKVSKNHTRTSWVLKCDIRKFFASVDQHTLIEILKRYIPDIHILTLLTNVIQSFSSVALDKGLPLGNLTSQLLVNIYMNEFDQFVKHKLKAKYYIRYADDFVIVSQDLSWLERLLPQISEFLESQLKLKLHPDKVYIQTLASGVDFLGWVHFPDHRVLRMATKRRMARRLSIADSSETRSSYLGLLKHGNTFKIKREIFA